MPERKQRVYGPVPSRRLGRSLGVDLVPFKTCTYDCIYCQLGPTTRLTLDREPHVLIGDLLDEIEARLAQGPVPEYVTVSGSGEPTLQVALGTLIGGIKRLTDRPVAVLTNGSLLWREDVRSELLGADLVMPSLDAGDETLFQRVNRPHPGLHFEQVVDGLVAFREQFEGPMWLEVFLLAGLTADEDAVAKIGRHVERIAPERVQINTVARPPCSRLARRASDEALRRAAELLGPQAELIADRSASDAVPSSAARPADVLALLERRPCTLADLAEGLGAHRLEVAKVIEQLVRSQLVVLRQHGKRVYYRPAASLCLPEDGAAAAAKGTR